MKQYVIKSSFKAKLVIAISIINLIVILLVTYIAYNHNANQLLVQTIAQTQQTIEQVGDNVNTYMNELYRLTLTPYYNDRVLTKLETPASDTKDKLNSKRIVENFLSSVMTLPRSEFLRVYIANDNALYSYTRTPNDMPDITKYRNSEWYRKAQTTTAPMFIEPHMEKVYGEKPTTVFSIVRLLRSKNDNSKKIGVIKVDADYSGISKICNKINLNAGGMLLMVNSKDQVLYSSSAISYEVENLIFTDNRLSDFKTITLNGEKYLVNVVSLNNYNINIIALHSYNTLIEPMRTSLIGTIMIALVCIIVSDIGFYIIIHRFTRQLFEVVGLMHYVENGDLSVKAKVTTNDEIGYLAKSFNHMTEAFEDVINQNTKLTKEIYQAQYLAKEAQYNSLCSQIRPHFLYNTLNTVSLLIKCKEYNTAIEAIESFSAFLGGVMNVSKEITMQKEIDICKAYLKLVQLRYQDRLVYSISISKKLLNKDIPSLSVQPLIENAVKHACEQSSSQTCIDVISRFEGDRYYIDVINNGPVIAPDTLEKLNKHIKNPEEDVIDNKIGNIGLVNISKRLRLKYGDGATIDIASSYGKTVVSLGFPNLKNEVLR